MKKLFIISICLLVLLPICLFAGDSELKTIQQIPQVDFKDKAISPSLGEYNGKGQIDAVSSEQIVIDDLEFGLSSKLIMKNINGTNYQKPLKKGLAVYYFLDQDSAISKIIVDPGK